MTARHHQHGDHERGFRSWHNHDDLGSHLHHRGPDYVIFFMSVNGTLTYTGTPDEIVDGDDGRS